MATRKKAVETAPQGSRAYENGVDAFGARYVRAGFALRPELDLAFALGHGAPGLIGPIELLPDLAPGKRPRVSAGAIARNVAIAALRKGTVLQGLAPHEAAPEPITDDEARAIVARSFPTLGLTPMFWYALEAMVGPSCLLPAVVQGLDAISDASWDTSRLHGLTPFVYGLMLRAKTDASRDARAALEAMWNARKGKCFAATRLDVMLHGPEGIARCGYKYSPTYKSFQTSDRDEPSCVGDLLYCEESEAFVATQFASLWRLQGYKVVKWMTGPSPARLFFLGGDAALETEALVVDRYPGTMQPDALASYRDLASDRATALIEKLATPSSKVKADAEAALRLRAARA